MQTIHAITTEEELRAAIGGGPTEVVQAKVADRLNPLTQQFVEASPFVCVATAAAAGGMDVSPRGDPKGFIRVLDERTLLLPERPGNRIADTLVNLLSDPRIALLFLIPGVGDTFRVNGTAVITDDRELLEPCAVNGRVPKVGVLITVHEAYTQCPKALIRSDLWNPEHHIERSALPSSGAILRAVNQIEVDPERYDEERAQRYARGEGLY